jgi:phosphate starvation-inducible PhoH-like protein
LNTATHAVDITLEPADNDRLAELCGQFDDHLRQLEKRLGVEINSRGNQFRVIGDAGSVQQACDVLQGLYRATQSSTLTPEKIHLFLQEADGGAAVESEPVPLHNIVIRTPGRTITPRGTNQTRYLQNIIKYDLNFGVGPAGTGKTYLAVACAVQALEQE